MKLSEMPIGDIAVGDKVVSAIGNPGHIVGIYPSGTVNPISGRVVTDLGTPSILMCWYGSGKFSMYEHAQLDSVEYDREATDRFRAQNAE